MVVQLGQLHASRNGNASTEQIKAVIASQAKIEVFLRALAGTTDEKPVVYLEGLLSKNDLRPTRKACHNRDFSNAPDNALMRYARATTEEGRAALKDEVLYTMGAAPLLYCLEVIDLEPAERQEAYEALVDAERDFKSRYAQTLKRFSEETPGFGEAMQQVHATGKVPSGLSDEVAMKIQQFFRTAEQLHAPVREVADKARADALFGRLEDSNEEVKLLVYGRGHLHEFAAVAQERGMKFLAVSDDLQADNSLASN
jgi:hypothetical protein